MLPFLLVAFFHLPVPSSEAITQAEVTVSELATKEISESGESLRYLEHYAIGALPGFNYYGSNPTTLSEEQAKSPALLLIHGSGGNQGVYLPLLKSLQRASSKQVVFTINYHADRDMAELVEKIEEIKKLYLEAGAKTVELNLVGYSRGAIVAAEYAFTPKYWVENVQVNKVISVAGRLKNVAPLTKTPHYAYCYDVLKRLANNWVEMKIYSGPTVLYTIAAEKDWLVPSESVLVGVKQATIPDYGHVLIPYAEGTQEQIISWLE